MLFYKLKREVVPMADNPKQKAIFGLDENIASLLCYLIVWITGIIIYLLEKDDALCGCIAIAHVTNDTAQLRFFFVDPRLRGFGAGDLLIEYALAFCKEKRYRNVFLWTCSHLASARHLYQKHGFQPTQTHPNDEWGAPVTEERWELDL